MLTMSLHDQLSALITTVFQNNFFHRFQLYFLVKSIVGTF